MARGRWYAGPAPPGSMRASQAPARGSVIAQNSTPSSRYSRQMQGGVGALADIYIILGLYLLEGIPRVVTKRPKGSMASWWVLQVSKGIVGTASRALDPAPARGANSAAKNARIKSNQQEAWHRAMGQMLSSINETKTRRAPEPPGGQCRAGGPRPPGRRGDQARRCRCRPPPLGALTAAWACRPAAAAGLPGAVAPEGRPAGRPPARAAASAAARPYTAPPRASAPRQSQ